MTFSWGTKVTWKEREALFLRECFDREDKAIILLKGESIGRFVALSDLANAGEGSLDTLPTRISPNPSLSPTDSEEARIRLVKLLAWGER